MTGRFAQDFVKIASFQQLSAYGQLHWMTFLLFPR
jgi:hypothetical protein